MALKIAFLFIGMPVGGAEDFALGVYPYLAPEVNARFVCLRSLDMLGEEALAAGLPVELKPFFPTKRINPVAVWKFSRWLKNEGIEAVHSQTYHAHLFGVAAAKLAGIPSIVHQQKTLGSLSFRKRLFFKWCLNGADKILTLSQRTRAEISEQFAIDAAHIEVVPNAIDDQIFHPSADKRAVRRSLGLPEDGFLFGTVASLHPVKNHKAIIEALSILAGEGERPTAVFVGDGVACRDLESLAVAKGVGDQVVFAGRRRPVAPWFQALDAFVLPSVWEGQALALLQAISTGLPVLASRIEGNIAVLGEDHPSLFNPDDHDKLASLLRAAISSPSAFLARGAFVSLSRDAAMQLKKIYAGLA